MPRLVAVLGSVTPPGRFLRALTLGLEAARTLDQHPETELLNLADYRLGFADGRPLDQLDDDTPRTVKAVAEADVVLLASPVYRASFSGVLKNFLDLVPLEALSGKPCGIVAMGATEHHYLGVDAQLRAVLAWFGALVAPNSVYLASADFVQGEPSEAARTQVRELIETLLVLHGAVSGRRTLLGPSPLAAHRP